MKNKLEKFLDKREKERNKVFQTAVKLKSELIKYSNDFLDERVFNYLTSNLENQEPIIVNWRNNYKEESKYSSGKLVDENEPRSVFAVIDLTTPIDEKFLMTVITYSKNEIEYYSKCCRYVGNTLYKTK